MSALFDDWLASAPAQFHFLRPWWLLVLAAAALLLWAVRRRGDVRRRWQATIAPHLLAALMVGERRRFAVRPVHLTALLLVLGAIALAGPSWEQETPPFLDDKAPLAIAVDLSRSMDAIDVSPTRLERAKLKVKAMLARRDGGRTAIYAYADSSAGATLLVLPLTEDNKLLETFVDALQTSIMPPSTGGAARNTASVLRQIDAALAREEVPGTILFLTDGVEAAAAAAFKAQGKSGRSLPVVLGIGTAQGGPLRNTGHGGNVGVDRGGADGDGFVEQDGRRVFARMDVAAFKRLGSAAGIPVATLTPDSDDDVAWVQRHVQAHRMQTQSEASTRWKDEGWWLTIPIALLGVLWFRKGWTVRWIVGVLLVLMLGAPPSDVRAQPAAPAREDATPRAWRFADLWLTHDQQGRWAFEHGDYATAAARFDDPTWRGVALYRAGRYAEAVRSFALVDSAQADFNQGNALAHQGKYEDAIKRYQAALDRQPQWAPAAANLALVRKLIPPKPKDKPEEQEEAPNLRPDKVEFDKNKPPGPPGKQVQPGPGENADTWMRAIQTTPTELLARKFALQQGRAGVGAAADGGARP